jgi:transcriptional regulator with XRE-family HTH domain
VPETHSEVRELIGRRIRAERLRAGHLDPVAFAASLGIEPARLAQIEAGECEITSVFLQEVADRLELPLSLLVRERREGVDPAFPEMVGWSEALLADMQTMATFVGRERPGSSADPGTRFTTFGPKL